VKKVITLIFLTLCVLIGCLYVKLSNHQVYATTIFSLFIFGTLIYWQFRLAFAFLGISALFITGVINIGDFLKFANFDIIFFLVAMMIIVGFLEKKGFLDYMLFHALKYTKKNARIFMISMMLLAAFMGALVDEVTSILFMVTIIVQMARRYKVNPVPLTLMLIFATNIGSSATVIGNPIGILIAFRGNLTFFDFLRWATPISFIVLLLCIFICMIYFSKDIKKLDYSFKSNHLDIIPKVKQNSIGILWIYVILTFGLLIFHSLIEEILHLEKNTMLLGSAFFSAGLALLIERKEAKALVFTVDWWTICFFALFFASVGALEHCDTIDMIGNWMIKIGGNNQELLFFIFSGASAVFTPIIDNVLVISVFSPIVESLNQHGIETFSIWWGMLFGGALLGNLTMIGSTANIIALGFLETRKIGKIGFFEWFKVGFIISVSTFLVALILLYIQFPLM